MKLIDVAKNNSNFNSWIKIVDTSIMFINWCYLQLGVDIHAGFNNKVAYDNMLDIGEKVSKSNVKEGDIVFSQLSDNEITVGIFVNDCGIADKFNSIEAISFNGEVFVKERVRKYTDCVFIRPTQMIESVIESKSKKKK